MATFLKVILGIVIISVAAAVLLVIALREFAKTVHVQESGSEGQKTVNVETPFGHIQVHENDKFNPAAVGIPVYPGAVRTKENGGASFQFDAGDVHKDFTITGAKYITDDSPEKVRDFYEQKFPSWNLHSEHDGYNMERKEDGGFRAISIKREDGHTTIGVASGGPPASN
jgi:hypothetical protein